MRQRSNTEFFAGLNERFQTRIYRLGSDVARVDSPDRIAPVEPATHIAQGLEQLAKDTEDLPIGAIILLSDGSQNSVDLGGDAIGADALQALRNRRLPVHTVGFGNPEHAHDVEMEDVSVAASAVANARVAATVTLTQHGYAGRKAMLAVRDGDKAIAEREITLEPDGRLQSESVLLFPLAARVPRASPSPLSRLEGEESLANNAMTWRPVLVSDAKRRILYNIEGEPRWEYKFIRRAEDDDLTVQIVSMMRTSENKVYRQGISDPGELAAGFPVRAEDLFRYSGIIIGSVAADYFTPLQQELLREYVDRRGGGILFLGGRFSLSDGGWGASSLNELLPTFLPSGNHNFRRNPATVALTTAGIDLRPSRGCSTTQAEGIPSAGRSLPTWLTTRTPASPKPGATELIETNVGRRQLPLLVTQRYGFGRTAILATMAAPGGGR